MMLFHKKLIFNDLKMIKIIAQKEWTMLVRDRRLVGLSLLAAVLLAVAALVGYAQFTKLNVEREAAKTFVRAQWLNQGEQNAHSAAHYGTFAYRPKSALSFLDFGVDNFTGSSIYLEAHRQNNLRFSAAQDSGALLRFGELTAAFVLQMLVPLLIIFLSFNVLTTERENGTLRLLAASGVDLKKVAWGKILGISKAVGWAILPAILIAAITLFTSTSNLDSTILLAGGILLFLYILYFFICIAVSVVVSAYSGSSRAALVRLLGGWILLCVILPKLSVNVGSSLFAAPSSYEFFQQIRKDEEAGIDGHNTSDKRLDALKTETLKKYGVDSVEKLPVNWDAIVMQEGERHTSMIYNKRFGDLQATFAKQNAVSEWASFLSPYLGIRALSMGLSGSDYRAALDFQRQAEAYRFQLVQTMNETLEKTTQTGDWDFKHNVDTWSKLPDFQMHSLPIGPILNHYLVALIALATWIGVLYWFLNKKLITIPI